MQYQPDPSFFDRFHKNCGDTLARLDYLVEQHQAGLLTGAQFLNELQHNVHSVGGVAALLSLNSVAKSARLLQDGLKTAAGDMQAEMRAAALCVEFVKAAQQVTQSRDTAPASAEMTTFDAALRAALATRFRLGEPV